MNHYLDFCKKNFDLLAMARKCPETRKQPSIPMPQIFLLMIIGLSMRRRSFHQIDQFARMPAVKRLLGSTRSMVASDATLGRVLPTLPVAAMRELAAANFVRWKQRGGHYLTLPSGRRIRLGIVDGTMFGRYYASCLQVRSDAGDCFVDLEVQPGRGHELYGSETVLKRAVGRHGWSFVDLVAGDGLYMAAPFFRKARQNHLHMLVKLKATEEGTLLILKAARALFDSGSTEGVERVEGVDEARGVRYRIQAASGFEHEGYDEATLKVARVVEEPLKPSAGAHSETFWVVSTNESFKAIDLRELAHQRWSVENLGFKMLSDQMNSKHVWTRGKKSRQTIEVLMLLMFVAFTMVKAFEAALDERDLWMTWRLRKLTLEFLVRIWESTLTEASPLFEASG